MLADLEKKINIDIWLDKIIAFSIIGLKILAIIILYMVIKKIIFKMLNRWVEKTNQLSSRVGVEKTGRMNSIETVVKSSLSALLAFVLFLTLMGILGINIAPLLATAGVAGLAIGFGAQKIVKDVVSGLIIISENQYEVGEYITIGTFTGEVIEIGIRSTKIEADDGRIFTLSNGDIINVTNFSRGGNTVFFEQTLPFNTDIDLVISDNQIYIDKLNEKYQNQLTSKIEFADCHAADPENIILKYKAGMSPKYYENLKADFYDTVVLKIQI